MRGLAAGVLLLAAAVRTEAWPAETLTAIGRDGRRLLPQTLSRLLGEREVQIREQAERLRPELVRALARDQVAGRLSPETIGALDGEVGEAIDLLRSRRVSEGLVRLGALLRISADLSDPVLAAGAAGWPPGLAGEYYALFRSNLGRMPVVLGDPGLLETERPGLPRLWNSLLERSREQAPVIRGELFRDGRVIRHQQLDYRSPAWAVASLSYSRAVTATAATWLAVWREAGGDPTRRGRARTVAPVDEAGPPDNRIAPPEAP